VLLDNLELVDEGVGAVSEIHFHQLKNLHAQSMVGLVVDEVGASENET
jgi:hypothetical protein